MEDKEIVKLLKFKMEFCLLLMQSGRLEEAYNAIAEGLKVVYALEEEDEQE